MIAHGLVNNSKRYTMVFYGDFNKLQDVVIVEDCRNLEQRSLEENENRGQNTLVGPYEDWYMEHMRNHLQRA